MKNTFKGITLLTVTALLMLVAGCTKNEVTVNEPGRDCPIEKNKLLDKDWYIFSPSSHASANRLKWGSDGNWYGAHPIPCGPFTWISCSTFTYINISDSTTAKCNILVLQDNYLKFQVIESQGNAELIGTIYELDRVPH